MNINKYTYNNNNNNNALPCIITASEKAGLMFQNMQACSTNEFYHRAPCIHPFDVFHPLRSPGALRTSEAGENTGREHKLGFGIGRPREAVRVTLIVAVDTKAFSLQRLPAGAPPRIAATAG